MYNKIIRGITISFLSAIIITFVMVIFGPFLPINLLQGNLGFLFFILIIGVSYVVYYILPPDSPITDISIQKDDNIQETEEI